MALNTKLFKNSLNTTTSFSYSSSNPSFFSTSNLIGLLSYSSLLYTVPSGRIAKVHVLDFTISIFNSAAWSTGTGYSVPPAGVNFNGISLNDSALTTQNGNILLNSSRFTQALFQSLNIIASSSNVPGSFSYSFNNYITVTPNIGASTSFIQAISYSMNPGNTGWGPPSSLSKAFSAYNIPNVFMSSGDSLAMSISLNTGLIIQASSVFYSGINSGAAYSGYNPATMATSYNIYNVFFSYSILVIEESSL